MTDKSQHTPGPWHFDGWQRVRPVAGDQSGRNDICHCYEQEGRDIANGQLIAAAPDMLEACRAALNAIEGLAGQQAMPDDGFRADVAFIQSVINKATGA